MPWPRVADLLQELLDTINRSDCIGARELLMQAVVEYRPDQEIQDLVWMRNRVAASEARKVTDLKSHRSRLGL